MTDKPKFRPAYTQVNPYTWVCIADADTRAVVGAKTSRAANLETRWLPIIQKEGAQTWGEPTDAVRDFLVRNLAGYSHASIGEMAECFVHVKDMGWPTAYLVEDFPLFIGQEVSTRAVDMTKDPRPARHAPQEACDIHDAWLEVFREQRALLAQKGGYKFDNIRWALPGTTRSGVTYAGQVRSFVRHLEEMCSLGDNYAALAADFFEGIDYYAPEALAGVRKGPRKHTALWSPRTLRVSPNRLEAYQQKTKLITVWPAGPVGPSAGSRMSLPKRDGPREHLDKAYNSWGRFSVRILGSVAAARDWHRHRAAMPWELSVLKTTDTDSLIPSPFYPEATDPAYADLWDATSKAHTKVAERHAWDALFVLPFGATVQLTCTATLPALLYMLELRYSAAGANFEYKEQARQGLLALARVLSPQRVADLHILGCIPQDEREEFSHVKDV